MRDLTNEDGYLILEIIDKTGFELPAQPKMSPNLTDDELEKIQDSYGKKMILGIVTKLYRAKEPVNKLIASVLEKDIAEVRKMKLKDTIRLIKEIFTSEGLADFFK